MTTAQAGWQNTATAVGLLVLRLGVGGYMLTHGWGKLQSLLDGQYDAIGDPIGLGGFVSLTLAVLGEFVCSLLVMAGLATRLAAVPLVITMAVAAFVVHGGDPWSSETAANAFFAGEMEYPGSKEPAIIYLLAFLTLVFTGAGRFSIDALIQRRRKSSR